MLTKRIIPCIDVDLDDDGNAAVYTGVNFENLKYTGDPVEMAKAYNAAGADEFVFLDITASADGVRQCWILFPQLLMSVLFR